jgi:hypothetical protein
MNARLRLLLGVVLVVAGTAAPAAAHRLDEYLQATRLGIDRDRIEVEITLTPGADIASQIVALIDVDGNGVITEAEGADYVRRVVGAVTLTIDGRAVLLRIDGHDLAEPSAMRAGVGAIRIRGSAALTTGAGRHHLAFANGHLPQISVYLVNALVPSDPAVTIGAPRRDRVQRALNFDFDVQADRAWTRAAWILIALALLGGLATVRRQQAARAIASIALTLVFAANAAACGPKRPSTSAVPINSRFTLSPGETTAIDTTPLWIRFDRVVEDSRCPADVQCIQAGDGVVGITVIEEGASPKSYLLHTGRPGEPSVVHGNLTITLEELMPTPVATRKVAPREYRATLRASR